MREMTEAQALALAARPRPFTDPIMVRCPACGAAAVSDPQAVRWAVEMQYDAVGVTCGACGRAYEVGVEVEVTLASPPREGGAG